MNVLFADARILGMLGRYGIEAGMHEVDLKDGSLHRLHFVRKAGARSQFLRALQAEGGTFYVFDLRDIALGLCDDIPGYVERDVPRLVKYTLRLRFATGPELRTAIQFVSEVNGLPAPQAQPQASAA